MPTARVPWNWWKRGGRDRKECCGYVRKATEAQVVALASQ